MAERLDEGWRERNELPLLDQRNATSAFAKAVVVLAPHLALRIVSFKSIPFEQYFETASAARERGSYVGIGYRARFFFHGNPNALHVSSIAKIDDDGLTLDDIDYNNSELIEWSVMESAVLSADSGFWIVSNTENGD